MVWPLSGRRCACCRLTALILPKLCRSWPPHHRHDGGIKVCWPFASYKPIHPTERIDFIFAKYKSLHHELDTRQSSLSFV